MPFDQQFTTAHEAFQEAVGDAEMRCQGADDIWKNEHILDSVLEPIWTARVVVSDLTDEDPTIFYETGAAHTLGRYVILTNHGMDPVLFNLPSIRALTHLPNGDGLAQLERDLTSRSEALTSEPKGR